MNQKKMTVGRAIIYLVLTLLSASIVVAFWHLLNLSLSPSYIATKGGLLLYPKDVTLDKEYKNIEAVSAKDMSGVEEYIRTELDTRVPPSDDDDIEAVNDQYLAKKTEEFMKQYGDRKKQD